MLSRSQQLYVAFAIRCIADLISPQVAASALEHSLWLPAMIAGGCLLVSYPFVLAMTETLPEPKESGSVNGDQGMTFFNASSLKVLPNNWKVWMCMCISFLLQFRYINRSVLLTYASVRFSWSIAQVSRLLSIIPAVSLIVFVILPSVNRAIGRRVLDLVQSYVVLAALVARLIIGDALIAAASSMRFLIFAITVFAIGDGVRAPLLAVASSYIHPGQQTASLFTLLSVTDAFAHMVGDPLLQTIWKRALNIGGHWLILPFLTTLVCFTIAFCLTLALPIDAEVGSLDREEEAATEPLISH